MDTFTVLWCWIPCKLDKEGKNFDSSYFRSAYKSLKVVWCENENFFINIPTLINNHRVYGWCFKYVDAVSSNVPSILFNAQQPRPIETATASSRVISLSHFASTNLRRVGFNLKNKRLSVPIVQWPAVPSWPYLIVRVLLVVRGRENRRHRCVIHSRRAFIHPSGKKNAFEGHKFCKISIVFCVELHVFPIDKV